MRYWFVLVFLLAVFVMAEASQKKPAKTQHGGNLHRGSKHHPQHKNEHHKKHPAAGHHKKTGKHSSSAPEVSEPAVVKESAPSGASIPNCASISNGICVECVDGYSLDPVGHLCYLTDSLPVAVNATSIPFCWRSTAMAPHGLTDCPGTHSEMIAGLCYVPCNQGYASDAGSVTTCSELCGDGAESTGFATCMATPFNFECDPCGAWAVCDNCGDKYTSTGACLCTANSWTRDWYDRGVGIVPSCPPDQIQAGALCYDPCPTGFEEVLTPLECKMSQCPDELPYFCGGSGGAACSLDSDACFSAIENMVVSSLVFISNVASDLISAGAAVAISESAKAVTLASIVPRLQEIISVAKETVGAAQTALQILSESFQGEQVDQSTYLQLVSDIENSIVGLASLAGINIASDIDPTGLIKMALSFVFPDCGDINSLAWQLVMEFISLIAPIIA